jgi:hypothetical protein
LSHGPDDVLHTILVFLGLGGNQIQVIMVIYRQHSAERVGTKVLNEGSGYRIAFLE